VKYLIFVMLFSVNIAWSQAPVIDKNAIGSVIDGMIEQGTISADQGAAAKLQMNTMNSQDWVELTDKADEVVNRDPKLKKMLKEGKMGNTPQFNGAASIKQIEDAIGDKK
jgi:hypothetical protein